MLTALTVVSKLAFSENSLFIGVEREKTFFILLILEFSAQSWQNCETGLTWKTELEIWNGQFYGELRKNKFFGLKTFSLVSKWKFETYDIAKNLRYDHSNESSIIFNMIFKNLSIFWHFHLLKFRINFRHFTNICQNFRKLYSNCWVFHQYFRGFSTFLLILISLINC